jgi:tetratricopeptide (TPR) repeat protein
MPGGAQWNWTEAYGYMQADAETVHGNDWERARAEIQKNLDKMVPEEWLKEEHERAGEMAQSEPVEITQLGSGWGSLERNYREKLGEPAFNTQSIRFDDTSLEPDQEHWLELLQNGVMPYRKPEQEPGGFIIEPKWQKLLKKSLEREEGNNWLAWLHLGVMYHAQGEYSEAETAWQESLRKEPNVWAYRNLAILYHDQKQNDVSCEMMQNAWKIHPKYPVLARECTKLLWDCQKLDELGEFLRNLPETLQNDSRIAYYGAFLALENGEFETVERYLADVVIEDLRENEISLTELWFSLQEHKLSKKRNIPIDKDLKKRVREEFPAPKQIDYRMSSGDL